MNKRLGILLLVFLSMACENNSHRPEPVIIDDKSIVEKVVPDTMTATVQNEEPKVEEKSSVSASSSSSLRSHKSNKYDNMRGFDPASEDDMEDNGMSRYMENNDEEEWD